MTATPLDLGRVDGVVAGKTVRRPPPPGGSILRALVIEDDREDATLVLSTLSRAGFTVAHQIVATPDELTRALSEGTWDIVIADHVLPAFSSTAALKIIEQGSYSVPLLVLSEHLEPTLLSAVLRAGAYAALSKADLPALPDLVDRVIKLNKDMVAKVKAEADLEELRESYVTSLRDNLEHLSDTMDEYHHDAQEAVMTSDKKVDDQVNRIVNIITEHAQREEVVLRELKASVAAVNTAYIETATNFGKLTATIDALPEKIAAAIRKPAGKMSWVELIKEQPDRAVTLAVVLLLAVLLLISQGHSIFGVN